MNVKLLKEEIKAAEDRIQKDRDYIRKAKQEIAEYLCPFKVGDEIMSPDGKKEIISSIHYVGWSRASYSFKVFKIKKNGEPYKIATECYNVNKYRKWAESD